MLALIIGAIAVLGGVALGYVLGKSTTQAEGRLLRERAVGLESEKTAQQRAVEELQARVTALTGELGKAEASLTAEQNKYAQMQTDLANTFGSLAADALRANNQSFLELAKEKLGAQANEAQDPTRPPAANPRLSPESRGFQSPFTNGSRRMCSSTARFMSRSETSAMKAASDVGTNRSNIVAP